MAKFARKQLSSNIGFHFAESADLDVDEISYRDIKSAYRMFMDPHGLSLGMCKKNCRNNPKCLCNLGEKVWFEDEEEDEEFELENELLRSDGIPSGLRNLGNTCYVNSFLQIWFHNSKFRQSLYEWDPGEDPEEQNNESILDPDLYEPRSKVASLQALFVMMQYTKRKYADPTDFICKLGLNPSVQQDAQEFSKLFVSLLENSLEHQSNLNIKTMIQKQFRGEYAYVTSCLTCKRESVRPSYFYELDLALTGKKNLTIWKCIEDFLRVEKMTGDEKYYCESCETKQEATRCCKLTSLPPVLNLQLNRFQYDMHLGRKKKLNSCIMYPEELDMSKYLQNVDQESSCYRLTGVLMHVGPDANHGHYIAHIQELETGHWFKFSDEHVVSIDRKNIARVNEKGCKKIKSLDVPTGGQSSNNAYMLVYMLKSSIEEIREHEKTEVIKRETVRRTTIQKRNELHLKEVLSRDVTMKDHTNEEARGVKRKASGDSAHSIEEIDYRDEYCYSNCRVFPVTFQPHLRNKIDKDNLEFDEEIEEKKHKRLESIHNNNRKKQKMRETYRSLLWLHDDEDESGEDSSFEFVPKNWLMAWLSDTMAVGPIETKHYLCVHGNLDIDRLGEMKLCDSIGVNSLIEDYGEGEGPRLTSEKLCTACVKNKARIISLDYKLQRDQEFIKHQLKVPMDGKGFWVGKKSLNNWKKLAKLALEDTIVKEVQQWSRTKDQHKSDAADEKTQASVHEADTPSSPNINLIGLKAKLERMGTNVSVAPGNTTLKLKTNAEGTSGISVIRNGESFRMANIAEVKLNLDDSLRGNKTKPSCVVKPIVKPVQAKPSATVRPLNIQEDLLNEKMKENEVAALSSASNHFSQSTSSADMFKSLKPSTAGVSNVKPFLQPMSVDSVAKDEDGVVGSSVACCANANPGHGADLDISSKDAEAHEPVRSMCRVVPTVNNHTNGNLTDTEDIFNADIVCPHGNLRIEERCKQLVSREVWFKLCNYFHNPKTFQFGIKPCAECRDEESRAFIQREKWREEASRQKSKLSDLFTNIERPKWSKPTTRRVFLLSSDFVLAWRSFVRGLSSGKGDIGESITDVNNSILLCAHGGLLHVPQLNWENEPDVDVVMVREEEWSVVREMFNVDHEIRVDRENTPSGPVLTASPAPCHKCVKSKVAAEQESRLTYSNEVLFVTFLTQDEEMPNGERNDPEFFTSSDGELKMCESFGMRRSKRRKKGRGEREFVVSSDTLLRDFKVQIMEVFKVAPYDQILFLNGEYLRDNAQSLGSLGVLPGSAIFLKADNSIPCPPEDLANPHPELGFKGTGLLSG